MKRILLSAVVLLSVSLSAQVGINTTSPEKTLDVNGEVKVRTLKENSSPKKVVVVGSDNVLSTAPLNVAGGILISGGGNGNYTVGKTYTCNDKNNYKMIFLVHGHVKCTYSSRRDYYQRYQWSYNGLSGATANQGLNGSVTAVGLLYTSDKLLGTTFISGTSVDGSAPLHVIDDSQYKD